MKVSVEIEMQNGDVIQFIDYGDTPEWSGSSLMEHLILGFCPEGE